MKTRLNRITTKTGDQGETGLADGSRLPKTDVRIAAMGSLDELNCALGVLLAEPCFGDKILNQVQDDTCQVQDDTYQAQDDRHTVRNILHTIQQHLFDIGSAIALPGHQVINDETLTWLEEHVATYNAHLPPLTEFILPGGNRATALCHQARSVCRRTERDMLSMQAAHPIDVINCQYLNRLSDVLFIFARILQKHSNSTDILWKNP